MSRRNFLKTATAATLATAAGGWIAPGTSSPAAVDFTALHLPTISLGSESVSRLIAGWNPIGGNSHSVPNLSRHMLEYFTPDRINDFLLNCEIAGINTWVCSYGVRAQAACDFLKSRNSRLKVITQHAERRQDAPIESAIRNTGCIALVHHGVVTDSLFRSGRQKQVRDYIKKVRDQGVMVGISTHSPGHLRLMNEENWDPDFYMAGFFYVNRTITEQEKLTGGKIVIGEPFYADDPEDMTREIRQVQRPVLAFKILGSGRLSQNPVATERAFRYAFEKIKPADAIVVGMYPKFRDEIRENVSYTQKYALGVST